LRPVPPARLRFAVKAFGYLSSRRHVAAILVGSAWR
jgi:hypothetical protein